MTDELLELARLRADLPPADEAAMARARATLVHTATSAPVRRRRFPTRIATTATVGAAAVAALLLVPGAGGNAPTASAVTLNDNGTVTIEMNDITDMAAANKVLEDAGIRAEVVRAQDRESCVSHVVTGPVDGLFTGLLRGEREVVTFRPDKIPAGAKLLITGALATHLPGGVESPPIGMAVSMWLYFEDSGICDDGPLNYFATSDN
jgi:hypothetical protein